MNTSLSCILMCTSTGARILKPVNPISTLIQESWVHVVPTIQIPVPSICLCVLYLQELWFARNWLSWERFQGRYILLVVNAQPYLASLILIWALTISVISIYGASANSQKVHLESASAINLMCQVYQFVPVLTCVQSLIVTSCVDGVSGSKPPGLMP